VAEEDEVWPDDPPPHRVQVLLARSTKLGPHPARSHAVGINRQGYEDILCPGGPVLKNCTVVVGQAGEVTCPRCRTMLARSTKQWGKV
jgi:hypothetical protein